MATPEWNRLREDLAALHAAALEAAAPGPAVSRHLRVDGDTLVAGAQRVPLAPGAAVRMIAFGKASAGMARAALTVLGTRVTAGLVIHPHALDPGSEWPPGVKCIGAGHPVPDAGSMAAGEAALEMLAGARNSDVVLALVSGGGSALLEALRPGLSLRDLQDLTRALQRSGADIVELNTVRRALSRLKGGGLARNAAPARVVAMLLSDVMGDRPDAIASGPTVRSTTGAADALRVIERRGVAASAERVVEALRTADRDDTPFPETTHVIVGSNRLAAEALGAAAERRGFQPLLLTQYLQGEAREAGRVIGGMAKTASEIGRPLGAPACLICGGETTVTVRGGGRGGRNQETALGAAVAMAGGERMAVFCFGTDGIDGASEAAGAIVTGETLARAAALGLSFETALAENDSETFFRALGDLWITGPTGTNVNDLAVALVYP